MQYSAFKPSNGYFHFEGTMFLAEGRHGRQAQQQPLPQALIGHRCARPASDWSLEALVLISLTVRGLAFCWFEIDLGVFKENGKNCVCDGSYYPAVKLVILFIDHIDNNCSTNNRNTVLILIGLHITYIPLNILYIFCKPIKPIHLTRYFCNVLI